MAETNLKYVNRFTNGLKMDLPEEGTPNDVLTDCLNGTIITYNGNEGILLNDMGNARVETAFLPEGYVPVGTCSFGGIIYIVSYNPLENKSLIGCFPSPERNIDSEDMGGFEPILDTSEFVKLKDGNPTGEIIKYSTKKILTVEALNPGDKFAIHWDTSGNFSTVSNFGNELKTNTDSELEWPKLMKIKLVAIEESGKINYLDNTTQWYNYNESDHSDRKGPYFIKLKPEPNPGSSTPDLDSYRQAVGDAYSVFQSKVSGKLALLIELEKLNSFSCAIKVIKAEPDETDPENYLRFKLYASTSWEATNKNINPIGIIVQEGIFEGGTLTATIAPYDNILSPNNTLKYSFDRVIQYTLNTSFLEEGVGDTSYTQFLNLVNTGASLYTGEQLELKYQNVNGVYLPMRGVYKTSDGSELVLKDDIVNTYYNHPVLVHLGDVKVPKNGTRFSGTYSYKISPCMPYGVQEELLVEGKIDFSLFDEAIELNTWKYYVDKNSITLTWGLLALLGDKTINKVEINLYDNQGQIGLYCAEGYDSYHGKFTEYLTFNAPNVQISGKYKVGNITKKYEHFTLADHLEFNEENLSDFSVTYSAEKRLGLKVKYSEEEDLRNAGDYSQGMLGGDFQRLETYEDYTLTELTPGESYPLFDKFVIINLDGSYPTNFPSNRQKSYVLYKHDPERWQLYKNDAGILYYGYVYLAVIKVYITEITGDSSVQTYYRWMWTNEVLNSNYKTTDDFKECHPTLNISSYVELDGLKLKEGTLLYRNPNLGDYFSENSNIKTLGAQVTHIGFQNRSSNNESRYPNEEWDSTTQRDEYNQTYGGDSGKVILRVYPGLNENVGLTLNSNYYDHLNIDTATYRPKISILRGNLEVAPTDLEHVFSDEERAKLDFLNPIIETNLETPTSNLDTILSSQLVYTPSEGSQLFTDSEDNYLNYKDWFKLSVVEANNTGDFYYQDTDGTAIHTTELNYSTTTADVSSTTGIQLHLKGLKYNKLYAYSSTPVGDYKVLKSILKDASDFSNYNLGILSNGDLYFKKGVFLYGSREDKGNVYIGMGLMDFQEKTVQPNLSYPATISTPVTSTVSTDLTHSNSDSTWIDHDADIPEVTLSKMCLELSHIKDYGFIPMTLGGYVHDYTHNFQNYTSVSLYSIRIEKDVKTSVSGYQNKVSEAGGLLTMRSGDNYIGTEILGFKPGTVGFHGGLNGYAINYLPTVLVATKGASNQYGATYDAGSFTPTNDFVSIKNYAKSFAPPQYYVSQDVTWKSNYTSYPARQAQMIGSLLGQLYMVNETENEIKYSIKNLVELENHTEFWQKDIILRCRVNASDDELTSFLNIGNQILLTDWANVTLKKAGAMDSNNVLIADVNMENLLPFATPLTKVFTQLVLFGYNVKYNISALRNIYEPFTIGENSYYDFLDNNTIKPILDSLISRTLYVKSGESFIPFAAASRSDFKELTQFKLKSGSISAIATENTLLVDLPNDTQNMFSISNGLVRLNVDTLNSKGFTLNHILFENRGTGYTPIRVTGFTNKNLFDYTYI